jgi:hypothetical protein
MPSRDIQYSGDGGVVDTGMKGWFAMCTHKSSVHINDSLSSMAGAVILSYNYK